MIGGLLLLLLAILRPNPAPAARAPRPPPGCEDILYYGRLIDRVLRTGKTSFGQVFDQPGLADYERNFGPAFRTAVERLRAPETWINFRAGRALAEREVLANAAPEARPRIVSILAYGAATENPYPEHHVLYSGQLIEEMDWSREPKAQLGSDQFGQLSYSSRFDRTLTIEGEALAEGAPLYVVMQRDRTLFREKGRDVGLAAVLARTKGLKVIRPVQLVPGHSHLESFVLERTSGPVEVPAMRLTELKMMLPPYRVFEL